MQCTLNLRDYSVHLQKLNISLFFFSKSLFNMLNLFSSLLNITNVVIVTFLMPLSFSN